MRRSSALLFALFIALAACQPQGAGSDQARLPIVATTTVIADLVANVGGDRVDVHALVPPGGEVHTFDPSPSDITRIEAAEIVFGNGLGLDEWLGDLITDAGSDAPLVSLGEDLDGVTYREGGAHEDEEDGEDEHGGEAIDPHLWLNVAYARLYVDRIADELSVLDTEGAEAYRANAEAYGADLDELDTYAAETLGAIAQDDRVVVSFHDAFGYFADAYGLTVVDTVVTAPGQDPSAGQVAALIDEIRDRGVRAILAESQFPTSLVERIAEETDAVVIAGLFSDTVGEAPNDTYLAMIRFDVDTIAQALRR